MRITYDKVFKDRVIELAGLKVGKNKYLVDKSNGKPVKDINGELIKYDQFAGFQKGSIKPIKSDLPSLLALSKAHRRSR